MITADDLPRGASAVSIATYAAAKRRYGMHTDNEEHSIGSAHEQASPGKQEQAA